MIAPCVQLLVARCGNTVVGLGFMVRKFDRRHGVLLSSQLRLQHAGNQVDDQIWPEYNEFLVDERYRCELYPQLMEFLVSQYGCWDELVVGVLDEHSLENFRHKNLMQQVIWEAPTYQVDLAAIRQTNNNYIDSLSRNSRYQIRRAIKKSGAQGAVELSRAGSASDALAFLEVASVFHRRRWGDDSGFHNPKFVAFHQYLIRQWWSSGVIEMLQLSIGGDVFAILYFFVFKQKVYFYLSGIDYDQNWIDKPGLVAHTYCVQKFIDEGYELYDFMGGDARYKRSLGQYGGKLVMASLQKRRTKFVLEKIARKFKRGIYRRA